MSRCIRVTVYIRAVHIRGELSGEDGASSRVPRIFFSLSPSLSFLRVGGPSTRARRGTPPFFSPYQRRIRLDGNEASIKGQRFLELREVQGRAVTIYDSRERVKNCRNGNEKERRKKLKWRNFDLEDFWNELNSINLLLQSLKFI